MVDFSRHQRVGNQGAAHGTDEPQAIGKILPEVLRLRGVTIESTRERQDRRGGGPLRLLPTTELPMTIGIAAIWPIS